MRVRSTVTNLFGDAFLPFNLWRPPFGQGSNYLQAGTTRAFQIMYRDIGSGLVDASNSVVVQFLP